MRIFTGIHLYNSSVNVMLLALAYSFQSADKESSYYVTFLCTYSINHREASHADAFQCMLISAKIVWSGPQSESISQSPKFRIVSSVARFVI